MSERHKFRRKHKIADSKGSSLTEHGVLIGLIALVAIGSVAAAGGKFSDIYTYAHDVIADNFGENGIANGNSDGNDDSSGGPEADPSSPSEDLGYGPGGLVVDISGTSSALLLSSGPGGAVIHWEEGVDTVVPANVSSTQFSHTYGADGIHSIVVEGDIKAFRSSTGNMVGVQDFGTVGITNLNSTFNGQDNLVSVPKVLPPTVTSMHYTFAYADSVPDGVSDWDTSNVTRMTGTFADAGGGGPLPDLSGWDPSGVSSPLLMATFFRDANAASQDLSSWCIENVDSEPEDFGANVGIKPWWGMCGSQPAGSGSLVATVNGSAARFDFTNPGSSTFIEWGDGHGQIIDGDKTVSHSYASPGVYTVKIDGDMDGFMDAGNTLETVSTWGNASLVNLNSTFNSSDKLVSVPTSIPSSVTSMHYTFARADNIPAEVSQWNTSNVTRMTGTFLDAGAGGALPSLSNWDVTNISSPNLMGSFFGNANAESQDLSSWCVTRVDSEPTDFGTNVGIKPWWGMCGSQAAGAGSLVATVNGSSARFDFSNPDAATFIEWGDGNGQIIDGDDSVSHSYASPGIYTVKIDGEMDGFMDAGNTLEAVSTWGDATLKSLSSTFNGSDKLVSVPTSIPSTVTSMHYTFAYADNIPAEVAQWDTSNVTRMTGTFADAGAGAPLPDLSNWDVSGINSAGLMATFFRNANAASQDLSGWCVTNVASRPADFGTNVGVDPVWGTCPP